MRLLLKIVGFLVLAILIFAAYFVITMRPNIPSPAYELTPPATTGNLNVLVFGGTRGTGLEVAKILIGRGDKVTAFVRPTSDRTQLEAINADFAVGDAMDRESVDAAFAAGEYDAVITTIGSISADPPPDYLGNANIFDAAVAAGVKRVLMVSSVGAGDSASAPPAVSRLFLRKILPLKTKAENHLRESGLDYTVIRPGGLPFGPGTGGGILVDDPNTFGFILRPDLARLIVGALDDESTIGKTLAAVDPARKSPWDGG